MTQIFGALESAVLTDDGGKRIKFLLRQAHTGQAISCFSTVRYYQSGKLRTDIEGEYVTLAGDFDNSGVFWFDDVRWEVLVDCDAERAEQLNDKTVEFRVPVLGTGWLQDSGKFMVTQRPDGKASVVIAVFKQIGNEAMNEMRIYVPASGMRKIRAQPKGSTSEYQLFADAEDDRYTTASDVTLTVDPLLSPPET